MGECFVVLSVLWFTGGSRKDGRRPNFCLTEPIGQSFNLRFSYQTVCEGNSVQNKAHRWENQHLFIDRLLALKACCAYTYKPKMVWNFILLLEDLGRKNKLTLCGCRLLWNFWLFSCKLACTGRISCLFWGPEARTLLWAFHPHFRVVDREWEEIFQH